MNDDRALLDEYATRRADAAFATLVERHLDLVYFTALRRCGGNAHHAQDVSQQVFTALARQATALARHTLLAGWLYVTTRNLAAKHMRAEHARRMRETAAVQMSDELNTSAPSPGSATLHWEQLRPVLDDLMDQLGERDRDVVLLRFFENRSFAEIGAALRTTADAARMRADRALDKLRVLLERRGIRSTGAALAAALAEHAALAKPAGLAAAVTTSALAGAAVATTDGVLAMGFMSTTKVSAGMVAAALALGVSLSGNAWMLMRSQAAAPAVPNVAAKPLPSAPQPPRLPADLVKSADLATLRDQLKSAGANDASIRAALEGILRRRYREQLAANNLERLHRGWWRDHERTWGTAKDPQLPFDDLWLMHRMVTEALEQLLGPDPHAVAAAEVRYAFLPAHLRQEFGRLERAGVGGWSPTGQPEVDEAMRAEFFGRRNAIAEERKELLAGLTPAQRDEYEMRFSELSAGLARQLQHVETTEQEFRTVYPIAQSFAKEYAALPRRQDNSAQVQLEQRTADSLVAAFGYERALDYIWASAPEYAAIGRVAREEHLPPTVTGAVVQLAAETAQEAIAIHDRASLSIDDKRAALLELQAKVRAQVDVLVPPQVQQRAAPHAFAWLNALGEGRYQVIWSALPGLTNVMGGAGSVSITTPRRGYYVQQMAPRRSGAN